MSEVDAPRTGVRRIELLHAGESTHLHAGESTDLHAGESTHVHAGESTHRV